MKKHDLDNRSRQLDPEHDAYWKSRGVDGRPEGPPPEPAPPPAPSTTTPTTPGSGR